MSRNIPKTVKTLFNDDNILKIIQKDYHFSKCYLLLIFVPTYYSAARAPLILVGGTRKFRTKQCFVGFRSFKI